MGQCRGQQEKAGREPEWERMDVEGAGLLGHRQQHGLLVNDRNSTPGPYVQSQSPEQLHVEMHISHPASMREVSGHLALYEVRVVFAPCSQGQ